MQPQSKGMQPQSKGMQPPEAGSSKKWIFPESVQMEHGFDDTSIPAQGNGLQTSAFQNYEKTNFSSFKPWSLWQFFYSGKRELTQRTVNLEIKDNELSLGLVNLRYPGRQRHPAQSEKKNMNQKG